MVRGLECFADRFAAYSDQYVLIGGTACSLIMEDAGLDFRATKDLDIVLYIEALNAQFVNVFWQFIKDGGYQNRQRSTDREIFYRFSSPSNPNFPAMLELFSRAPDIVKLSGEGHLTPIPVDEAIVSLSAILLNNEYYQFLHSKKQQINGLPVVSASHLIPLKARAWLDLISRAKDGADIDKRDIRKHKNDIIRLYQLLAPADRIVITPSIKQDMYQFLELLKNDEELNLAHLGLKHTDLKEIVDNLRLIYGTQNHSL
jgi:hypothetical protein